MEYWDLCIRSGSGRRRDHIGGVSMDGRYKTDNKREKMTIFQEDSYGCRKIIQGCLI